MITLILYYVVLLSATFLIARNAYKMCALNHDFTLPIITFFMYYFTLAGALIFPLDAYFGFKGGAIGLHYIQMFDRLFVVDFDRDYILSVGYYVLFMLVFQYAYIFAVKKYVQPALNKELKKDAVAYELVLQPLVVLLIALFCIAVSFYVLRDEIFYAISHEKSIYLITRATVNKYYTIHQLANEFCVIVPFIAFSFAITQSDVYSIKAINRRRDVLIILSACVISSLYIALLGNRREILSGLIICILIGINNIGNMHYKRMGAIFIVVLALFLSNDFLRSTYIPRELNAFAHPQEIKEMQWKVVEKVAPEKNVGKEVLGSFLFSNELFYAHFSMYGIIHKEVPITYGSSFVYLATSVVPRAIYSNRPPDIYNYYATSVNAVKGQIYTIHHAAAWYLNLGIVGLILGAVILAVLMAFPYYLRAIPFRYTNSFFQLLKYLLPFLLCSQIVTFITAGPEAYKSLMLEGVLLPIILLLLCLKKNTSVSK